MNDKPHDDHIESASYEQEPKIDGVNQRRFCDSGFEFFHVEMFSRLY